ncbi:MAG: O-acetyl-ADP-ribose deacetylase [Planctomycetota bacterium]|jgi:O-acetyl-ADP-ribose deacetylase (regulator of RNase III)|nr:O-acetyl-ADP-ribose deacetylase [Planctomycetota bacterium]
MAGDRSKPTVFRIIAGKRFELTLGDITRERVDGIVNAANSRLAGGGGVDGAIHRAGGPGIMAECRKIGGCPIGRTVATTAGKLHAKRILHTVGPIWRGDGGEPELLASCYRTALALARDEGLASVAFPSISTGVYSYPVEEAAMIAVRTIMEFLGANGLPTLVRMVLFDVKTLEAYRKAAGNS